MTNFFFLKTELGIFQLQAPGNHVRGPRRHSAQCTHLILKWIYAQRSMASMEIQGERVNFCR